MFVKQIEEAEKLAGLVVHNLVTTDISPAFKVIGVPSGGTGYAALTIAYVQGGAMTFLVDTAAPAGVDSIGTAGVIDTSAAAYNTVGEVVNYINSIGAYRAALLCDPATPMANVLAKTAASALGDGGLTFYLDTSVADTTYIIGNVPITGDIFFNKSSNGIKWQKDHAVRNYIHTIQFSQNFTSAATMYIKCFRTGDTAASTLWQAAMTDNTLMSYNVGNPEVPFIEAPEGYTLACEVRSDLATGQTVFQVTGKSVVRDGSYVVTSKAY